MLTLPGGDQGGEFEKPLNVADWTGPENGPYKWLGFSDVPNCLMPLAPVATWRDQHDLANVLARKLRDQAHRQKNVGFYSPAGVQDADRLREAKDGDLIPSKNPGESKEVSIGGIDQAILAFKMSVDADFKEKAGNLDSLGGLSAQSGTARQDELLSESASQRLASMQERTTTFVTEVVTDVTWHLYYDPHIILPLTKELPGTGGEGRPNLKIAFDYGPEDRQADFLAYNFEIEPYSMQHRTPATKLNTLNQFMQTVLIPLAPQLAEQGINIDWETILHLYATWSNMPELQHVLTFSGPQAIPQRGPVGTPPRQAPNTTRTNVRVNRPGASSKGTNEALMQSLISGAAKQQQPAQATG